MPLLKSIVYSRLTIVKKAFTLVEILIVITIIAILISISSLSFSGARQKSRDTARKKDLQAIKSALLLYWQDERKFPGTPGESYASDGTNAWIAGLAPTYIPKLPQDPIQANAASGGCGTNNHIYCYVPQDEQNFTLWVELENKKDKETLGKPDSTCTQSAPVENPDFNYCLTSPQ